MKILSSEYKKSTKCNTYYLLVKFKVTLVFSDHRFLIMPQTTRAKVAKRKLETNTAEKVSKASKPNLRLVERRKSLDTSKDIVLAHLNKDALKANLKSLQIKYDALVTKNIKNLEVIKQLNDKVDVLQKNALENMEFVEDDVVKENIMNLETIKSLKENIAHLEVTKVPQKTKESQTEETELILNTESNSQRRCGEEVWLHTKEQNSQAGLTCTICGNKFAIKWELMEHRKNKHAPILKTCIYYLEGNCAFGEDAC